MADRVKKAKPKTYTPKGSTTKVIKKQAVSSDPHRTHIPPEEMEEIRIRALELGLEGCSFSEIARKLRINHVTAKKYFEEKIVKMYEDRDLEFLLSKERARTERIYDKAVQRYYEGKYTPTDVATAAKMANRWNGLEAYAEKVDPSPAVSLLKVEVVQVPIQLPGNLGTIEVPIQVTSGVEEELINVN
jgi:hypothetical protein